MSILYDTTKDYLYQQGKKKAKEEVLIELLKDGTLPIEEIASLTKVSVDYVKQVARDLKQ
jgi:hypothetical protein